MIKAAMSNIVMEGKENLIDFVIFFFRKKLLSESACIVLVLITDSTYEDEWRIANVSLACMHWTTRMSKNLIREHVSCVDCYALYFSHRTFREGVSSDSEQGCPDELPVS